MNPLHHAAYLINLRSRGDRRRYAEQQLQRIGWTYERFETVKPTEPGGYGNVGKRGCAEAHFALLQQAVDRGNAPVLIMEDDLRPCDHFHDLVTTYHDLIRDRLADVDLVYYFNQHASSSSPLTTLSQWTIGTHFYVAMNPRKLLSLCDHRTVIDVLYIKAIKNGTITAISPSRQIVSQNLKCGTDIGFPMRLREKNARQYNDVFVNG